MDIDYKKLKEFFECGTSSTYVIVGVEGYHYTSSHKHTQ
jgi:hypothetical protein